MISISHKLIISLAFGSTCLNLSRVSAAYLGSKWGCCERERRALVNLESAEPWASFCRGLSRTRVYPWLVLVGRTRCQLFCRWHTDPKSAAAPRGSSLQPKGRRAIYFLMSPMQIMSRCHVFMMSCRCCDGRRPSRISSAPHKTPTCGIYIRINLHTGRYANCGTRAHQRLHNFRFSPLKKPFDVIECANWDDWSIFCMKGDFWFSRQSHTSAFILWFAAL